MENVHSEISVTLFQPHLCFESLAFLFVSPQRLLLPPPFLLLLPGAEWGTRMMQRLGLSAWTSLFSFVSAPRSYAACSLQRFVAFTHSFYIAPGRAQAGRPPKDVSDRKGGRWGKR